MICRAIQVSLKIGYDPGLLRSNIHNKLNSAWLFALTVVSGWVNCSAYARWLQRETLVQVCNLNWCKLNLKTRLVSRITFRGGISLVVSSCFAILRRYWSWIGSWLRVTVSFFKEVICWYRAYSEKIKEFYEQYWFSADLIVFRVFRVESGGNDCSRDWDSLS